jgi:archaemetzincin
MGILAVGTVPTAALEVISDHIGSFFGLSTKILPRVDLPPHTRDERRMQYNAAAILKAVESMPFERYEKIIAVLNVDLFIPVFTHVFGEAREGGKCALVSLFRLRQHLGGANPGMDKALERLAKVTLHEAAHLFNLVHCMDPHCLMHFSMNLQDLDNTPVGWCRYCRAYLEEALRHLPRPPPPQTSDLS